MKAAKKDANIQTEIGELLLGHEMAEEAVDAFEGALKVDPRNVHVYNRLGIAYRRQGKYIDAIEQYKRALKVAPNDENIYYNLGRALLEAARSEDARKAFESALKINPDFREVKKILSTL
jgi:tetratricopeptide (TPR) repeat protein